VDIGTKPTYTMVTKTIASVVVEMLHFINVLLMNPVRLGRSGSFALKLSTGQLTAYHSYLSASIGSTCAARRAGRKHAMKPTRTTMATTETKVIGSLTGIPQIWLAM
jgi:hypothetical protein